MSFRLNRHLGAGEGGTDGSHRSLPPPVESRVHAAAVDIFIGIANTVQCHVSTYMIVMNCVKCHYFHKSSQVMSFFLIGHQMSQRSPCRPSAFCKSLRLPIFFVFLLVMLVILITLTK